MLKEEKEAGYIMVEASIYFPIVIFTVFAMIYFGMMKYQESILTFQVQKLAVMGGRQVAYYGYDVFAEDGSLASSAVDFKEEKDFSADMKRYYDRHSEYLYSEWESKQYVAVCSRLEEELSEMLSRRSFLTGVDSTAVVKLDGNPVIGRSIVVEATYGLRPPKLLSYVGVPMDLTLRTVVVQSASNPTELVRNVDLALDLIDFLLERFGVKDRVDSFLKKAQDIKNKIL